jgi:tetratricopeptide (TPR) repeat protein
MDEEEARLEYLTGMEAYQAQQYDKALLHFRRSNALSEHFKTWQRIGQVLEAQDHLQEADECWKRAYQLNSKNSQVAVGYAEVLLRQQKHQEAVRVLDEVLEANTTYGPAKRLKERVEKADR